jgi:ADP-heptose:LPS heptosyltransferase
VEAVQTHAGRGFPVLPQLHPRILGALLSHAAVYLGNDSGVTHLAGVSGAPVVALFGPTDPVQWRPLGDVVVLRRCTTSAGSGNRIRVCDDPACMQAISVDDVLEAIDRLNVQNSAKSFTIDRRKPSDRG